MVIFSISNILIIGSIVTIIYEYYLVGNYIPYSITMLILGLSYQAIFKESIFSQLDADILKYIFAIILLASTINSIRYVMVFLLIFQLLLY